MQSAHYVIFGEKTVLVHCIFTKEVQISILPLARDQGTLHDDSLLKNV
jgi:hypothetical protein